MGILMALGIPSGYGIHSLPWKNPPICKNGKPSIAMDQKGNSNWLVVDLPSEKYDFVNGKDDIPYMKWKMHFMFETTNQPNISHYSPHDNTYFTYPVPMRNFGCDGEVVYTKCSPQTIAKLVNITPITTTVWFMIFITIVFTGLVLLQ